MVQMLKKLLKKTIRVNLERGDKRTTLTHRLLMSNIVEGGSAVLDTVRRSAMVNQSNWPSVFTGLQTCTWQKTKGLSDSILSERIAYGNTTIRWLDITDKINEHFEREQTKDIVQLYEHLRPWMTTGISPERLKMPHGTVTFDSQFSAGSEMTTTWLTKNEKSKTECIFRVGDVYHHYYTHWLPQQQEYTESKTDRNYVCESLAFDQRVVLIVKHNYLCLALPDSWSTATHYMSSSDRSSYSESDTERKHSGAHVIAILCHLPLKTRCTVRLVTNQLQDLNFLSDVLGDREDEDTIPAYEDHYTEEIEVPDYDTAVMLNVTSDEDAPDEREMMISDLLSMGFEETSEEIIELREQLEAGRIRTAQMVEARETFDESESWTEKDPDREEEMSDEELEPSVAVLHGEADVVDFVYSCGTPTSKSAELIDTWISETTLEKKGYLRVANSMMTEYHLHLPFRLGKSIKGFIDDPGSSAFHKLLKHLRSLANGELGEEILRRVVLSTGVFSQGISIIRGQRGSVSGIEGLL